LKNYTINWGRRKKREKLKDREESDNKSIAIFENPFQSLE
jgi:hypothetical protein